MIRFVALGLVLLGLAAGLLLLRTPPAPELIDPGGARLTAGPSRVPPTQLRAPDAASQGWDTPAEPLDELAPARLLLDQGRPGEAKTALLALLEASENDGETCILLSRVTRELDEYEAAVDWAAKATVLLPENGAAWHAYAKALAEKMFNGGRLAALPLISPWREAIRAAVEHAPENLDARLEEVAFYLYLPGLLGGSVERAVELIAELEQVHPARGRLWRALAHQKEEEFDEARALCEAGIQDFPEEGMFAVTLGNLHREAERWDEAREAYRLARSNGRGEAYWRAGIALARLSIEREEDLEPALEAVDEYIAARPTYPLATPVAGVLYHRGRILALLGRTDEARAAFEACLGEMPEFSEARSALDELE